MQLRGAGNIIMYNVSKKTPVMCGSYGVGCIGISSRDLPICLPTAYLPLPWIRSVAKRVTSSSPMPMVVRFTHSHPDRHQAIGWIPTLECPPDDVGGWRIQLAARHCYSIYRHSHHPPIKTCPFSALHLLPDSFFPFREGVATCYRKGATDLEVSLD